MVLDNSEWWEEIHDKGLRITSEGRGRLFLIILCSFFGISPLNEYTIEAAVQS